MKIIKTGSLIGFPKNIPDEIDLVVSSIGGAATTCLLNFYLNTLKQMTYMMLTISSMQDIINYQDHKKSSLLL